VFRQQEREPQHGQRRASGGRWSAVETWPLVGCLRTRWTHRRPPDGVPSLPGVNLAQPSSPAFYPAERRGRSQNAPSDLQRLVVVVVVHGQINAGAAVFFDNVTGHNVVNASGAGLFPLGVAVKAAGTNDATVRVRLNGVAVAAAGAWWHPGRTINAPLPNAPVCVF